MEKEATIYLLDLTRSMGKKHAGRDQSDLDWALQYVWDKITNTVSTGRKTLQIGVVGMGTDGTSNDMQDDDSYRNISVLQPIAQVLMPELRALPTLLVPSKTDQGDLLSAIIIAADMMMKHCKKLKYKKRIVVVTNAMTPVDDDDVESTAEQFKSNDIELVVLGVDFDDAEYGFKEEDKPALKQKNEKMLRRLVDLSGGTIGTMQEAIDELSRPRIKPVRPTPTYRGQLRLGDPENYDSALTIDVERFFKTSIKRPPTASAYAVQDQPSSTDEESLSSVHNLYKYKVKDENSDGTRDIEREELAKGYEYGRTAVAISETEQNITKLETFSSYDILGFIPAEHVERYMLLDNASMVIAQKGNDKAALALSSLVHALFELGSVAVGRLVKKDMSEPILTILSPSVEADWECLMENILPFAEDLRSYRFPPLDKVVTISGKELTEHRHLPSTELSHSMSAFVDAMNLVQDDDDIMTIDDTFSPVLHTIEGAIRYRAIHPDKDVPKPPPAFTAYSQQPTELQEKSKHSLSRLMEAANVKKVPPKSKGRRKYREIAAPLSGLDVGELLRKQSRVRLSPNNAIPEFKQMLLASDNIEVVKDAVHQMATIIQDQIRHSFGEANYDLALEGLGVVRHEMLDFEEPALYNEALGQIKRKLVANELGGNRDALWYQIRKRRLGLITDEDSQFSDVSKTAADEFENTKA